MQKLSITSSELHIGFLLYIDPIDNGGIFFSFKSRS